MEIQVLAWIRHKNVAGLNIYIDQAGGALCKKKK
jgi:hypothetical protein